jgi:glycosyltransferase involved in cell wall biosynthesis
MISVSVVIAARDEPRLEQTVRGFCRELPEDGEIVVFDDASRDDSALAVARIDPRVHVHRSRTRLGVAAARNAAARLATGNVLVSADAHVDVRPGWLELIDHLEDPGVGAVGPTLVDGASAGTGRGLRVVDVQTNTVWLDDRGRLPYDVPLLPGFFIVVRRQVFVEVGGFDGGMIGWGYDDIEFCMHIVNLGYRCVLVPEVEVVHAPVGTPAYHSEWAPGLVNLLRMGYVHFGQRRLKELYDECAGFETFERARRLVAAGGAERRRAAVQRARRFDDEWFFALCGLG